MYVTLPKTILRKLKWRKGQKVVIRKSGSRIVIEDWKP
jgi:bifunctional DNA-binding transcriptional regulator/antitoxin component of YhaV-PrlF toxin-antitoxin module